jgi:hypothetical protein
MSTLQFNYKPMNAQQPANPSPAAFNPDPEDVRSATVAM